MGARMSEIWQDLMLAKVPYFLLKPDSYLMEQGVPLAVLTNGRNCCYRDFLRAPEDLGKLRSPTTKE